MRARLFHTFLALSFTVLVLLSTLLVEHLAAADQQAMFLDRLQDTIRFAAAAQQASTDVDTHALREDLVRYHEGFGIDAAIVDHRGTVLASSGPIDLAAEPVQRAVRLALAGRQSQNPDIIWPGHEVWLAVAVPVLRGDTVIGAALTISPTDRLRGVLVGQLLMVAAVDLALLLVLALLAHQAARWLLAPVYRLDAASRRICAGTPAVRLSTEDEPVEVRHLAASVNRLAEAVESAVERQVRFVADASHQLRNPLTALMLRVEALGAGAPAAKGAEVTEVLAEASRLHSILDELLHLAAAQNMAPGSRAPTDIVDLVAARVVSWRPLAETRAVTLDFEHPATSLAQIDPTLVSSILDAVLDNAIKFSPAGGRIGVRVAADDNWVQVDVTDEGPGVEQTELECIGSRFWRAPASQHVPGSGLGLSIARTLAGVNGGSLRFALVQPHGLRVSLTLPVSSSPAPADPAAPRRRWWAGPAAPRRRWWTALQARRAAE